MLHSVTLLPAKDTNTAGSTGENTTLFTDTPFRSPSTSVSLQTQPQSFFLLHARMDVSSAPVKAISPSGEKVTTFTAAVCPVSCLTSLPGTNSPAPGRILYRRAVLSRDADARNLPSFEKAQHRTASEWSSGKKALAVRNKL